jgi:hypothetical protein
LLEFLCRFLDRSLGVDGFNFAKPFRERVRQIRASGATTFRVIAAALNNRGVRTARWAWHDSTVRNLLARVS